MSERGSWCTEYIYCEKCVESVRTWLVATGATTLPGKYWAGTEITPGIFAGRIGGLYAGEELHSMEYEVEKLTPCHPIRLAVLAENGEKFFTARPHTPSERQS